MSAGYRLVMELVAGKQAPVQLIPFHVALKLAADRERFVVLGRIPYTIDYWKGEVTSPSVGDKGTPAVLDKVGCRT